MASGDWAGPPLAKPRPALTLTIVLTVLIDQGIDDSRRETTGSVIDPLGSGGDLTVI
jgi:hypothetical protein